MILKQIEMNRQEKLIQEEVREQENAMMINHLEKLQKEDYEEVRRRKEKQKALASDLIIANRDLEKQKEFRKQQDIVAELKVLEYQRDKAARDAAYEAEQEKKRQDREKEISRLRAKQERARDMQADKDALRAKREQERKEREWREKERLEAMKKRQIEEEMKLSREWQCRNKEHYLAVEAAKDRSEFQKVLKWVWLDLEVLCEGRAVHWIFCLLIRAQIELADKDKQKEEGMHRDRKHYSENLQRQIRENELVRIKERKAFFEEGVKLDDEAKARRAKLDDIKKKKLNELRFVRTFGDLSRFQALFWLSEKCLQSFLHISIKYSEHSFQQLAFRISSSLTRLNFCLFDEYFMNVVAVRQQPNRDVLVELVAWDARVCSSHFPLSISCFKNLLQKYAQENIRSLFCFKHF